LVAQGAGLRCRGAAGVADEVLVGQLHDVARPEGLLQLLLQRAFGIGRGRRMRETQDCGQTEQQDGAMKDVHEGGGQGMPTAEV
jgi:hypothetical protein